MSNTDKVCKVIGFGINEYISKRKQITKNGKSMFIEIPIPDPHPMQIIKWIQKKAGADTMAGNPLSPSSWVGLMIEDFNMMERKYGDGIGKIYDSKVTPEHFIEILEERDLIKFEEKYIMPVNSLDTNNDNIKELPSTNEVKEKLFGKLNEVNKGNTDVIERDKGENNDSNIAQSDEKLKQTNTNESTKKDNKKEGNGDWGFDV